jgi:hypothetical protein
MANDLRAASGLNLGAFQMGHRKPGAWIKLASASTRSDLHGSYERGLAGLPRPVEPPCGFWLR